MSDSAPTSRLFDRWSRTYDSPTLQRLTYRPIHDVAVARARLLAPASVLDLGCGTGQLTERLVDTLPGTRVVGLDLSAGMLAQADDRLRRGSGGVLVRGNAERLPFGGGTFDLVVCTESFHWYPDQSKALAEVARVLRPDGRLLIASIATATGLGERLLRQATSAGGRTIRAAPPGRLRTMLDRAGFTVVEQRRLPRPGLLPWPVFTEARAEPAA